MSAADRKHTDVAEGVAVASADDEWDSAAVAGAGDEAESPRRHADRNLIKITVNLPEQVFQDLETMAAEQGITKTETLRRAISVQKFLRDSVKDGSKILLEDPDKTFRLVHLL
jgi:hypothetical protein